MFTTPTAFATDLERAGVSLPSAARTALATLTAIQKAAHSSPAATLPADIEAGKVTPANAATALATYAQALLVNEKSQQALRDFQRPLERQFRIAIREKADDLIIKLRKPFDEAATVVQAAGTYFPADPTAEQVLAGGAKAAAVWEQLTGALTAISNVAALRVQIGDVSGHGPQDATWYITTAEDARALDAAHRAYAGPGNRLHNLAAAGFTLRLNTRAEATKVAALAREVTDQREAAEREAALAAHRKSWAPSLAALAKSARPA